MRNDLAVVGLACALWIGGATGCGVFKSSTSQASSESSSDSSGSSSKSSSGESESEDVAYERDVRDATARNAASAADPRSYEKSISQVAESHRITDWETDPRTYLGVGRGFAQAGVRTPELDRLADALAHGDPRHRDLIRSGYDAATP